MNAEDYGKRTFTKKGRKRFRREPLMELEYLHEHKDGKLTCCKCHSVVYLDFCPNDKCSNFKVQAGPRPKVTSQQLAELAFRSLTERGKTRLANQAIEDLEAHQPEGEGK